MVLEERVFLVLPNQSLLRALVATPELAQIRALSIAPATDAAGLGQGDALLETLLPALVNLARLRITAMSVHERGVASLDAASPRLATIDLSNNHLGPPAVRRLVALTRPSPTVLRLASCGLRRLDVEALATAPWVADLAELELTHVVQQQQGLAPGRAQMKSSLIVDDSPLEREADALGARAARGEDVGMFTGAAAPGSVQRKTKVNPVAAAKKDKVTLIGDGTPGNTGLALADLDAYIKAQADWFTEPTLASPVDRDAVWKVVHLIAKGPHVTIALPTTRAGEIRAAAPRR